MVQDVITLPGLEQPIAGLAERIACDQLGTVRRDPGRVGARWAPAAGVERAAAVGDAEQGDIPLLRRGERLGIEVRGAEQQPRLRARLFDVSPQRLHGRAPDRRLLAPAGDETVGAPRRSAPDTLELNEIAPLRLGQSGAAVDRELGDGEPGFAQLAYHQ